MLDDIFSPVSPLLLELPEMGTELLDVNIGEVWELPPGAPLQDVLHETPIFELTVTSSSGTATGIGSGTASGVGVTFGAGASLGLGSTSALGAAFGVGGGTALGVGVGGASAEAVAVGQGASQGVGAAEAAGRIPSPPRNFVVVESEDRSVYIWPEDTESIPQEFRETSVAPDIEHGGVVTVDAEIREVVVDAEIREVVCR